VTDPHLKAAQPGNTIESVWLCCGGSGERWLLLSCLVCVEPLVAFHGPLAPSALVGFRFSPEVIILAVRGYLRFGISYRGVEELLAERGIDVDHVSIYRWVQGSPRC
jgi:hypothetical protein